MIRRIVLFSVAALGLALVPLSATGYDAPPYATTVSDSTPAVGQPFTVTTTGIECSVHWLLGGCSAATLTITSAPASISDDAITIAGTKSLTKAAQFDYHSSTPFAGTVVWTVTLAEPGTYTLTIVRGWQNHEFMSEVTVVVGASDDGGRLSDTGFDARLVSGVAGASVIVGVVVVWLGRRRARDRADV
jgi:hypothetical protein